MAKHGEQNPVAFTAKFKPYHDKGLRCNEFTVIYTVHVQHNLEQKTSRITVFATKWEKTFWWALWKNTDFMVYTG